MTLTLLSAGARDFAPQSGQITIWRFSFLEGVEPEFLKLIFEDRVRDLPRSADTLNGF
mgnify:CR=1 FL=1